MEEDFVPEKKKKITGKRLFRYFLQGLLYAAPIAITLYIVMFIFTFIDGILREHLESWLKISIPGLGLIIIVGIITAVGYLGQTIVAQPVKIFMNNLMKKAPFVKVIYSAINDLFSSFVGKDKKFTQPVLVKVNMISELEKMGFITQEDLTDLELKDKVAVYFPHSYNFSGELFIVPREHVRYVDIPSAEAMKFIVSGGVSKAWD
jgi:uncharacterized membrane protein